MCFCNNSRTAIEQQVDMRSTRYGPQAVIDANGNSSSHIIVYAYIVNFYVCHERHKEIYNHAVYAYETS